MSKEQICENCGHDKAFHEIDNRGFCIYGMVIDYEGIKTQGCSCIKFKSKIGKNK